MPHKINYRKHCFNLFAFLLFTSSISYAQTIKGKAIDAASGEPLIGATVSLKGSPEKTLVRLDGSYIFKNVKAGTYDVEIN